MERVWNEDWFVEAQRVWIGSTTEQQVTRRARERAASSFFWKALGMRRPEPWVTPSGRIQGGERGGPKGSPSPRVG